MQQVDQQADQQEKSRQHEQLALHGDEITVADIGHQTVADARQREQVLDDHDAGDHLRERQSDDGDQLRHGEAQSHAQHRLPAGHATGHGHVDVTGGCQSAQCRAGVPHQPGPHDDAHRAGWQHQRHQRRTEIGPPALGESLRREHANQSGSAREQQDQQQTTPQRGHGAADDGDHVKHAASGAAAGQCRLASQRNAQPHRDKQPEDDQRERHRCPLADLGADGAAGQNGVAEITVQQRADPVGILRDQRPVQTELRAQRGDPFRRGIQPGHHRGHVAGQHAQCREHDDGDAEQRRREQQQTAYDESQVDSFR